MKDGSLKGIGGWLAIFLVVLVFNILYLVYDVLANFQYVGLLPVMSIILIIQVGIIIIFTVGFFKMISYDREGVELLKWALWLPALNILFLMVIFYFMQLRGAEELFVSLFQVAIWALIWTSYLKQSVRVENTYYERKKK